jgi:PAS domain S-box-containing protein
MYMSVAMRRRISMNSLPARATARQAACLPASHPAEFPSIPNGRAIFYRRSIRCAQGKMPPMNAKTGIRPSDDRAVPGEAVLRRLARPGISKKFLLLFCILLLIGLGNWLVIESALSGLRGAAAIVNVVGSLRWLSQRIQLDAHRIAYGHHGDRATVTANLDKLDEAIRALGQGGRVFGFEIHEPPRGIRESLDPIGLAVRDYRIGVDRVFDKLAQRSDARAELDRLYQDGTQLLIAADTSAAALTLQIAAIENEATRSVARLALLDVSILIAAFLAIRLRIVRPLLRLAALSRQFAKGNYQGRAGIKSRDEIGELATAFDHMADEIERDLGRISNDLVELKQTEINLRKLSRAVEHSPATVIIADSAGTIEYVNPKFTEITGYTSEETLGRTPGMLKSEQTPAEVYRDLWATLRSGREWRGELLNRKKNGEIFWEDTRISPIKDEQGKITHFIAVKEDITGRKRAEEEIRRLNADLERRVSERTQQLAATNKELEAFSYSVSHDLRAPLRGINGFAHLMEESCGGCDKMDAVGYLGRIRRASTRMGDLIDDLLNLARVTRSRLNCEPTGLSEMARLILADLAEAEPARQVQAEVQDGITITGDPILLRDVLQNLLGNAWKFTARRERANIVFGSREENGETVVFVADNGAGFDMKYADKLFGAFQRLHGPHDFEGTGIGLATVQRIIHLHGGRIWAEGHIGKGATFFFTIPGNG